MSQCSAILQHLEAGNTLTPLQAFQMYGCLALHSRCAELRKRGHEIDCQLVETSSGKRVGLYSIPVRIAYG